MTTKKTKKKEIEVISIKYFCPNLEKEIEVIKDGCSFSGSEQECDICGSHGSVTLYVDNKCECGEFHSVELSSW